MATAALPPPAPPCVIPEIPDLHIAAPDLYNDLESAAKHRPPPPPPPRRSKPSKKESASSTRESTTPRPRSSRRRSSHHRSSLTEASDKTAPSEALTESTAPPKPRRQSSQRHTENSEFRPSRRRAHRNRVPPAPPSSPSAPCVRPPLPGTLSARSAHELRLEQIAIWGDAAARGRPSSTRSLTDGSGTASGAASGAASGTASGSGASSTSSSPPVSFRSHGSVRSPAATFHAGMRTGPIPPSTQAPSHAPPTTTKGFPAPQDESYPRVARSPDRQRAHADSQPKLALCHSRSATAFRQSGAAAVAAAAAARPARRSVTSSTLKTMPSTRTASSLTASTTGTLPTSHLHRPVPIRPVPRAQTVAAHVHMTVQDKSPRQDSPRRRTWLRGLGRGAKQPQAAQPQAASPVPESDPSSARGARTGSTRRSLRQSLSGSLRLLRLTGNAAGADDKTTTTTATATATTGSVADIDADVGSVGSGFALNDTEYAEDGDTFPPWADPFAEDEPGSSRLVLSSRSTLSLSGRQFWLEAVEVKPDTQRVSSRDRANGGKLRASSPKRLSAFRKSVRRRSSRLSGGSFFNDEVSGLDLLAQEAALEKCRETTALRERDENEFRTANAKLPQREVDPDNAREDDSVFGTTRGNGIGHRLAGRRGAMMASLGRYSRTSTMPLARPAEVRVS